MIADQLYTELEDVQPLLEEVLSKILDIRHAYNPIEDIRFMTLKKSLCKAYLMMEYMLEEKEGMKEVIS